METVRELVFKYQTNSERIMEIADTLERENRDRNAAEDAEYTKLTRENQIIQMKLQGMNSNSKGVREHMGELADAEKMIRENMNHQVRTNVMLARDLVTVSSVQTGGLVAVKMQDIVGPLSEGLIFDKVGLPFRTGLAGQFVWPVVEAIEATIEDEGAELTDTTISLSKLEATPQRVGVAIPVTHQAMNQTEGVLEMIVRQLIPLGVSRLLNKIMFGTEKAAKATSLVGPFVGLKLGAKELGTTEPTFKQYNEMKAEVLETGIEGDHLAWVMTKAQKALAEGTPKDAGSGIMVCENDKIAGLPVFTTNYIGKGYIGLGDWSYQPAGLFGALSFIVDPYTKARRDAVDFVFNANFATKTLRKEAFKLAKTTAAV